MEIVNLLKDSKAIGCKWVFRKKYSSDGKLNTYKLRLVGKEYQQKEEIYYFDTCTHGNNNHDKDLVCTSINL